MAVVIQGGAFRDRSISVLIPTRAAIDARVYASHCEMQWPRAGKRNYVVCVGKEVAEAYNLLVGAALSSGAEYALTLEDDMLVAPDTVPRLLQHLEEHPELAAVSVLYHTKETPSDALLLGHPQHPGDYTVREAPAEGLVEVNAIPMGVALWRCSMFRDMPSPWFATTAEDTQDIYFCGRARAAGFRFAVDCGLRAGHLDIETGLIY